MTTFAECNFDFEGFLWQHGFDTEYKTSGEIRGRCPFCDWDNREPFCVNASSGAWICHYCDERGGPEQLVMRIARCSWKEAKERLEAGVHDMYSREDRVVVEEESPRPYIDLPVEFRLLDGDTSPVAQPYRNYADRRGIDDDLIAAYGIGYCIEGRYRGRLVVPVRQDGEVAYFVARDISGTATLKVLYPSGAPKSECLFNLDNVRGRQEVVVVEGVFDALVLPEMAVATCGKTMSNAQAALLKHAGVQRVIFAYDADASQSSDQMAERFNLTFDTGVLMLPPGQDPSSLGREEMLALVEA